MDERFREAIILWGGYPSFRSMDTLGVNYFPLYFKETSHDKLPVQLNEPKYSLSKKYAPFPGWIVTRNERAAFHTMYCKFLHLNDEVKTAYDVELQSIYEKVYPGKLIGVVVRGTDYLILRPSGHPVQPSLNQIFEQFDSILHEEDYIYLASDEAKVVDLFRQMYPNRIITSESMYFDDAYNKEDPHLSAFTFDRENDRYLQGFDYFKRIYILAHCSSLVGGMNGAVRATQIIKEGSYEHECILFNDVY